MCVCLVTQSCLTLWNTMDCSPPVSSVLGDSPGKNTVVGCHPFLQGIFPTRDWTWDWTQISHIAGGFFTVWTTREAQEYWSGYLITSPGDLTIPGIELGSPSLKAGSLPAELQGSIDRCKDRQLREIRQIHIHTVPSPHTSYKNSIYFDFQS